jgi:hypothetical protein
MPSKQLLDVAMGKFDPSWTLVVVLDTGKLWRIQQLGFALETGYTIRILGELLRKNLDSDIPHKFLVLGLVTLPHAPLV